MKTPEEVLKEWDLNFHYQSGNWTHNSVIGAMKAYASQFQKPLYINDEQELSDDYDIDVPFKTKEGRKYKLVPLEQKKPDKEAIDYLFKKGITASEMNDYDTWLKVIEAMEEYVQQFQKIDMPKDKELEKQFYDALTDEERFSSSANPFTMFRLGYKCALNKIQKQNK